MPAFLLTLLRLLPGLLGGSLGTAGVGKLLSSGVAQGAKGAIGGTRAAQFLGRGGDAIRQSGIPLAKHLPTAAGIGKSAALGIGGTAGFIGTDQLLFGEDSEKNVDNLDQFIGQPGPQAANQQVLSELIQREDLRQALELIGVDLDELASVIPQQQQQLIL